MVAIIYVSSSLYSFLSFPLQTYLYIAIMSDSLPKYSYNGYNDDTESAPLITREAEEQQKRSEMGRPTATSVGVATQSSSGPGPRHNVLYVFEPIYPVPGSMEQVVGVLGRDREVSPIRFPLQTIIEAINR